MNDDRPPVQGGNTIWIGFDPRPSEISAFAVARHSIKKRLTAPIPIYGLVLSELQKSGSYRRQVEWRAGFDHPVMWDMPSDAPMSTEFANSRFLVPMLAKTGWALFMDCDMLVRTNFARLFDYKSENSKYAVMCVKHNHRPTGKTKMDGQLQTKYRRKNWSSFMLFNCDHPSNRKLTLEMVNTLPGRDLHRFCWLEDHEIGELAPEWNYLVGASEKMNDPKIIHFTLGLPIMRGYENCEFADEWRAEMVRWAT